MTDYKRTKAIKMEDGDAAKVKRLFPIPQLRNFDPFVLLDEFAVEPPSGFPTHPHRGFEAITYMLKGGFRHQDNLGNDTTVFEGGAQRFTAGKGLSHSELPVGEDTAHGFQLWINLPKRLKGIEPEYQQVDSKDLPIEKGDGYSIRTIVGGKFSHKNKDFYTISHIELSQGQSYSMAIDKDFTGFVYLFQGELDTGFGSIVSGEAIFLESGDDVTVKATEQARFIFLTGKPHQEPIKQWGPYVD